MKDTNLMLTHGKVAHINEVGEHVWTYDSARGSRQNTLELFALNANQIVNLANIGIIEFRDNSLSVYLDGKGYTLTKTKYEELKNRIYGMI